MKLKILVILLLGLFCLFSPAPAIAKKKLPTKTNQQTAANVWVKPKLRVDHQALLLMLGGMQYADEVSYQLTYTAAGVNQGIDGSHNPQDGNTIKELVFGTCSGSDCAYHQEITDMVLTVSVKLTAGQTLTQKYRITP